MDVTAWKYPGTVESVSRTSGKGDWVNPNNATAADGVYTTWATQTQFSFWLRLTNFNFTSYIPAGATINGIEVAIGRCNADVDDPDAFWIIDSALYCVLSTVNNGNNLASAVKYPRTNTEATYGGGSNLWGWSPTRSNIIDSTFGLDFSASSVGALLTAYVDYLKIRVYYTAGGGAVAPKPGLFTFHG